MVAEGDGLGERARPRRGGAGGVDGMEVDSGLGASDVGVGVDVDSEEVEEAGEGLIPDETSVTIISCHPVSCLYK
jgi:hypothetical protein